MLILRRSLLIIFAAFVLWRIAVLGMSNVYIAYSQPGDEAAAAKALTWYADHPEAAYRRAAEGAVDNSAVDGLRRAYALNPTDARPLLALARLAAEDGDPEQAGRLAAEAARLQPASPSIQRQAAAFWVSRGNLEAAMRHWSLAMEADPSTQGQLFPALLAISENAELRGLFLPYLENPPGWWERFFAEVARRALDVDTVRALYSFRRGVGNAPLTAEERKVYMARLHRDGLITEAYLVWINGLSEEERAHLGLLHNGGFELPPTSTGFDWHLGKLDGVLIETATTYGLEGAKALHLIFRAWDKPFRHVHQPLFLDPGVYLVSGRVRADSLQSSGGLKWTTRCTLPTAQALAESERFLGSSEWRDFSFEVTIPESCVAQELRLVSAGERELERRITGGIWFDGMSIRRLVDSPQPPLAAANTPSPDQTPEPESGANADETTAGDEPPEAATEPDSEEPLPADPDRQPTPSGSD